RGDEVRGRFVLPSGAPLADARVELWSSGAGSLWCDSTRTDAHGRFAIPNVPLGALALQVYPLGHREGFPARTLAPLFAPADVGEIAFEDQELVTHSLAVALLDAGGEPVPGAELRVWHEASGRGLFASATGEGGVFALAGLPAGAYRVEARSALGWR